MNHARLHPHAPAPSGAGASSHPRHLLGLEHLQRETLLALLEDAAKWRERARTRELPCERPRGVTVCNAFFEDSTRTRISFELAEQRVGATRVSFSASGSSVSKGETLLDTARVIAAMNVDVLVVRHPSSGSAAHLARHLDAIVVNGGDGTHEHPTQGLLDLLTLRDAWDGRFEGRRMAIVGDIAHSRVARSAIHGLRKLGATITVAGPATLLPAEVESLGVRVAHSADEALEGADAAMALRIQRERMECGLLPSMGEYAREWGLNAERVSRMKPHAVVMHPGPMNRGVEIAPDVADGERSVIFDQVENGVAVRCAVLEWCAGSLAKAAA
ncbi:MAG: aspartate carbamoyltransferase catalytic subunit [Candidatus Eisenbacteria bacterium]|uniref:Aspartate carbamoyltransferase n=1 Tax=Eiseniibacteriota bacterium TaxID=2212470 RepID=A0A849SIV0_UNCEI|nr:aspartate carbamoyltransferase catalytic subunit [Candidatus Eisenbacteria bacterium]